VYTISVRFDIAPIHARAVEGSANSPSRPTATSPPEREPADIVDHRARRLGQRLAAVKDPRRDLVRHAETDEEFAMTGRGHRAAGMSA